MGSSQAKSMVTFWSAGDHWSSIESPRCTGPMLAAMSEVASVVPEGNTH